jgi:hypothetical protein
LYDTNVGIGKFLPSCHNHEGSPSCPGWKKAVAPQAQSNKRYKISHMKSDLAKQSAVTATANKNQTWQSNLWRWWQCLFQVYLQQIPSSHTWKFRLRFLLGLRLGTRLVLNTLKEHASKLKERQWLA